MITQKEDLLQRRTKNPDLLKPSCYSRCYKIRQEQDARFSPPLAYITVGLKHLVCSDNKM